MALDYFARARNDGKKPFSVFGNYLPRVSTGKLKDARKRISSVRSRSVVRNAIEDDFDMASSFTRRKTQRKDCIVEARAYADHKSAVHCIIRDVTPEGAKLVAKERIAARRILLFLPAIGEVWAADVRWRRGETLGIQFVPGEADLPKVDASSDPGAFALRLQVAQAVNSAQRLPKSQAKSPPVLKRSPRASQTI